MNLKTTAKKVLVLIILASIVGCSRMHKQHYVPMSHEKRATERSEWPNSETLTRFSIIEFDDYGDYWDKAQVQEARLNAEDLEGRQVLLIFFIHGWRHNARANDSNLQAFGAAVRHLGANPEICRELSQATSAVLMEQMPCAVHGVYISWRGESIGSSLPIDYLSFWERKSAARRVSSVPATSTILMLLSQLRQHDQARWQKERQYWPNYVSWTSSRRSRTVLTGHSFGARFLESALAQALIARMEDFSGSDPGEILKQIENDLDTQDDIAAQVEIRVDSAQERVSEMSNEIADLTAALEKQELEVQRSEVDRTNIIDRTVALAQRPQFAEAQTQFHRVPRTGTRSASAAIDEGRAILEECTRDKGMGAAGQTLLESLRSLQSAHQQLFAFRISRDWVENVLARCTEQPSNPIGVRLAEFKRQIAEAEGRIRDNMGEAARECGLTSTDPFDDLVKEYTLFDIAALDYDFARIERVAPFGMVARTEARESICGKNFERTMLMSQIQQLQARLEESQRSLEYITTAKVTLENLSAQQRCRHRVAAEDLVNSILERVLPPYDLAIMLNPATEGIRAVQISEALNSWSTEYYDLLGVQNHQTPALHIFSSMADRDTRRRFPRATQIGQYMSLAPRARVDPRQYRSFSSQTDITQEALVRLPLPFVEGAVTHEIVVQHGTKFSGQDPQFPSNQGLSYAEGFLSALKGSQGGWAIRDRGASQSHSESQPDTRRSVWIITANGDFVKDHGDVFGQATGELVGKLLATNSLRSLECGEGASRLTVCSILKRLEDGQCENHYIGSRDGQPPVL